MLLEKKTAVKEMKIEAESRYDVEVAGSAMMNADRREKKKRADFVAVDVERSSFLSNGIKKYAQVAADTDGMMKRKRVSVGE